MITLAIYATITLIALATLGFMEAKQSTAKL
jgi:hypothetical protein